MEEQRVFVLFCFVFPLCFLATQMRKTIHGVGMGGVNISGYYFTYHHAGDSMLNRIDKSVLIGEGEGGWSQ